MNKEMSDEYGESIGAVMDARKQYDDVCAVHGTESWAAEQAHDYLQRATVHRDDMRERYDGASGMSGKKPSP
ncbi:MAG: hypothetical protein ACR2JC_12605 [Chloroflexota bacterium]|nr:MAG: hypothetical protein DLM70_11495 [Chloroflexota bacterium]